MAFPSNSLIQVFDTTPAALGITTDLTTNAYVKTTNDITNTENVQYWTFVLQGTFAAAPGAATNPIELHLRAMNVVGTNDPVQPGGGTTAFTAHKAGDILMADTNTAQYSKPLIVDLRPFQNVTGQVFEVYLVNTNTPTIANATADLHAAPSSWGRKA